LPVSTESDPYYYAREHDGAGWSVRGPDGFCLKKTDGPLDKNVAFVIAKLLSDQPPAALALLRDLPTAAEARGTHSATPDCWCQPVQDADEPTVWIHNEYQPQPHAAIQGDDACQ
jgi:hypothetical protein